VTALDALTLTTVPIRTFFNDIELSLATGFVYRRREQLYLVTNWHVLTARNAETGAHLHKGGARPNRLRAQFNLTVANFGKEEIEIKLRDDNDAPLWLVHPVHPRHGNDKRIDVAAIPLGPSTDKRTFALYPINDLASDKLKIVIGMDVFILAYPFGAKPPGFPVWKRGSIASEPDLVRLTDGYYLVDTASRPGMSGSPVVLRSWSGVMEEPGVLGPSDRPFSRFIGVYSGRFHAGVSEAQIGMVWHELYIDDIIDGGKVDMD
jgi:Trypsin-like peptidase domain